MRLFTLWTVIVMMSTLVVALSGTIHWPMLATIFAAMSLGLLIMVNIGKIADQHFVDFCSPH
ncbi:hypothetical protein [Shewanella colwelliana]|uniref:Uncharacterized protein n=1 Tax=Shewanella colwelliana TaxID=23 RepID=A0A1E5IV54_SHECO|nr:hypothetical protein [Shewanella colwelliana]MDX1282880.1 hypothetical protein [Shewanella colwelliana]OEG74376.1 hypothetical protein BEL05_05905 [Shewanella colwelliana]